MLDESLFLWNKDSTKRLFIEVDACNEGWGACVYQYADSKPPDVEDEDRYMLMSKLPKRVIEWGNLKLPGVSTPEKNPRKKIRGA